MSSFQPIHLVALVLGVASLLFLFFQNGYAGQNNYSPARHLLDERCVSEANRFHANLKASVGGEFNFGIVEAPNAKQNFPKVMEMAAAEEISISMVSGFLGMNGNGKECGDGHLADFLTGKSPKCRFSTHNPKFKNICKSMGGQIMTAKATLEIGKGFDLNKVLNSEAVKKVWPDAAKYSWIIKMFITMKEGSTLSMDNIGEFCAPPACLGEGKKAIEEYVITEAVKALDELGLFQDASVIGEIMTQIPGTLTVASCNGKIKGAYRVDIHKVGAELEKNNKESLKTSFTDVTLPICGVTGIVPTRKPTRKPTLKPTRKPTLKPTRKSTPKPTPKAANPVPKPTPKPASNGCTGKNKKACKKLKGVCKYNKKGKYCWAIGGGSTPTSKPVNNKPTPKLDCTVLGKKPCKKAKGVCKYKKKKCRNI